MVLAIGLVVDDAIVVLENIFRHIEEGKTRIQAALLGAKEIGFAVVAMTLTLVTVYAPLAFATGPHRSPLHRIRAGAGGRRAVLGLHRPDADPHDVLAAAAARDQTWPPVQPGRRLARSPEPRLSPAARVLVAAPAVGGRVGPGGGRRDGAAVLGHQERTRAGRRSRHDLWPHHVPPRGDGGLHHQLPGTHRTDLRRHTRSRGAPGRGRLSGRDRRQRHPAAQALGRTDQVAAADRPRAATPSSPRCRVCRPSRSTRRRWVNRSGRHRSNS